MTCRRPTFVLAVLVGLTLVGCGKQDGAATADAPPAAGDGAGQAAAAAAPTSLPGTSLSAAAPSGGVVQASAAVPAAKVDPIVVLHTSLGDLVVRLFEGKSPRTVANFLDYARVHHYDGTLFHHVESGFAAIAGAYDAKLQARPVRYPIQNEAANGLKNVRGSLAMVHDPADPHSATATFFINLADNPKFDHRGPGADEFGFCVFGQVIEGLDVLDKLAAVRTGASGDFSNMPAEPVVINSVKLARVGVNTNVRPADFDNKSSFLMPGVDAQFVLHAAADADRFNPEVVRVSDDIQPGAVYFGPNR